MTSRQCALYLPTFTRAGAWEAHRVWCVGNARGRLVVSCQCPFELERQRVWWGGAVHCARGGDWWLVGRRAMHYVSASFTKADTDGGFNVYAWHAGCTPLLLTGCSHARIHGDLPAKSRACHSPGPLSSHSASTVEPPWTSELTVRHRPSRI